MYTYTTYRFAQFVIIAICLYTISYPKKVVAQQNSPLPVGKEVQAPALQSQDIPLPVFIQAVSGEKVLISAGGNQIASPDLSIFRQSVTDSHESLSIGEKLSAQRDKTVQTQPFSVPEPDAVVLSSIMHEDVQKLSALNPNEPVGTPDQYVVPTDQTLTIAAPGFLANDIDLDGEALTATAILDNVDNGSLAAFADGSFNYTPNPRFIGTDSFVYRMRDASNNISDSVTVTIEVLPPANRNPVGMDDMFAALSGTTLSIASHGFLANDIDPDGETLTATAILDNVDNGSLAAFADGSFNYTPNPGFIGTDVFVYRMRDASNNFSDSVTVTIEVFEGNRAPIGVDDHYTAVINSTLSIAAPGFLANDLDLDGEVLTATAILDNVDNGSLAAFADGRFNYTPNPGFTGTDSFVYRMRDASNNFSDSVTVTIEVSPSGTTPVGTPDQYVVPTDQTLIIAAPGFLANDIDLDGEALTATAILDNVDNGSLAAFADGRFNYTPNPGFIGTDFFVYRMRDASNNISDSVTVTIEVLPPANRNPVGMDDMFAALSGTTLSIAAPGFLANDIDPDGETLTATAILDNVDNGSLAAFADGSFNYTPNPGFIGTDVFVYRMRDASNNFSDSVTVTIEVFEGNRAPIGVDDQYTAVINTTLIIAAPGFLANDLDLDGEVLTATAILDNVDNGSLAAFADGRFNYTPNPGFTGTDSFVYRMRDASNNFSDSVTVTIETVAPNQPPLADAGDDQTVDCDGTGGATITLDGTGSSDPDGDPLTYTWRENGDIIAGPTTEVQVEVFLTLGVHVIELTVEDTYGEANTDEVTITIQDTSPPMVLANFVPVSGLGNSKDYTIECSVEDLCDEDLTISSVIVLPVLNNPVVKYMMKKERGLTIKLNKNEVTVEGPDPQGFWAELQVAGGIPVMNNQFLTVKTENDNKYAYTFNKNGNLTSIKGPEVTLRCTATDGSNNTTVAEATLPMSNAMNKTAIAKAASSNTSDEEHDEVNSKANKTLSDRYQLEQNYPNPFDHTTMIRFTLPESGHVQLGVYDQMGVLIDTLVDGILPPGQHSISWEANNLSNGTYYYRFQTGNVVQIRKMLLIK